MNVVMSEAAVSFQVALRVRRFLTERKQAASNRPSEHS